MLRYKTNFIRHNYALRDVLAKKGGTATIDVGSMEVIARINGKDIMLHPQFVVLRRDGKMHYSQQLSDDVVGFFGWLPYLMRMWPLGQDKLAFKQYIAAQGLTTPRWDQDPAQVDFTCIIKATQSSFGYGIRGPYLPDELTSNETVLQKGEYYEQLTFGRISKAWYWNDRLAAIELFDMPTIKGDGRHTLIELVRDAVGKGGSVPSAIDRIARVQGVGIDDVLAPGKAVVGDYRYVSPLNSTVYKNYNVLAQIKESDVYAQFEHIGRVLYAGITAQNKPNTAYSVDSVVDVDNRVWLLEMNCNPQLHPDVYSVMFETLLE